MLKPDRLLLDEPLASLDRRLRGAVRDFEAFFRWIDEALMPYARAHRMQPCSVCRTRRHELPLPAFEAE